ncbi:hypothetical protein AK812_SmicGene29587 [Symbiodinium microadriaticum]|uniref:Uncharacterized protein n=1 Tax=Symbiodinium microadriaticum TaxID=2951 RepID=A0A1Q9D1I2_SYMMI|nr:hypothetical protein AK812_SmicGene29587 [Symbiodinium microadriaticum]
MSVVKPLLPSAVQRAFRLEEDDEEAPDAAALQEFARKGGDVWKFMAVQLTYNSSHGDFASLEETVLRQLFSRFLAFLAWLARELKAEGTSATMEKASPLQVHLHAYLHLAQPFHRRGRDALHVFEFEGVRPHLSPNTTSGKGYMGAVRYGHFYVIVDKVGTLFNSTDFPPFKAYGVEGWWLDNLLKAGKLTRQTYLRVAAQVTVGFQKRLGDCKAAERYLHDQAVRDAVQAESKALESAMLPMKTFGPVEEFVACHDGQPRFRRPVLAIVGGTRLGKSMLAAHTLKRVANKLGLADFLEVTVEDSENMDLADFDRRVHAGVLLDGVGDAMFLKRNREALQGRPKIVKGARSATNVFSYSYSFCGRAVVATFDLSAQNLEELQTDHWLCNRQNVQLLNLQEPAYIEPASLSAAESDVIDSRSDQRKRRSRDQFADFAQSLFQAVLLTCASVLADELADLRRRRAAKRQENRELANQEKALKKRRSRLMQADLQPLAQGAAPGPVVPVAAVALPGGDRGEAIAIDDADLEMRSSEHGVVVDADLEGSGSENKFDWLVSIFWQALQHWWSHC